MNRMKHGLMQLAPHGLLRRYLEATEKRHRRDIVPLRQEMGFRKQAFPLLATRRSDTVFLLGSGSSINRISDTRWAAIGRHDSFGLNFWVCHPFVPTHFFYEPTATHLFEPFQSMVWGRESAYGDVQKILTMHINFPAAQERQLKRLPASWIEDTHALQTTTMFARNQSETERELIRFRRDGLFSPAKSIQRVFKYMGTMTSMISIAVLMGYRHIVLCGVDMTTPGYFFHDNERYPGMEKIHHRPGLKKHSLMAENLPHCGADVVIKGLNQHIVNPAGSRLYVEHESSGLFPELPVAPASFYEV